MGRTIQSNTAEKVIRCTHAAGIKVAVNIVVGFPGEYNRKFEETLEFLRRNPHPIINHLYMTSTLQVNRGTPLHQRADQFGLIFSEIEPQNRWYTLDGNTYAIRKQRQHEVRHLALSLRMEVGHTFLENPAKEHGLINKYNPIYRWKKFLYHCYSGHEALETVNSNLHLKILARIVSHFTLISEAEESDLPLIESIREGSKPFVGPEVIHLDLTNRCNMNCIACWDRSPLVFDRSTHNDPLKKTLPFEIIKSLIDDLIQLKGLHQIKLGGGGEPTMHPNFKEILAYVRNKDRYVKLEINTNFSLVDKELIKLMIEFEVDLLTISLWAGTSDVYRRTHPNQSKGSFDRIVANIKKLAEMRKNGFPRISIHNVIMNLNYQDVDAMLELALDLEADEINYVLIDPVPDKTENLLLNQEERQTLLESFNRIKQRTDQFIIYVEPATGRSIRVANLHELIQKLSMPSTEWGIYDKKAVDKIPCYIGWLYTRVMADGKVAPCCKGHRLPMGDLNKSRFKEIWYSPRYMQFRHNSITLKKSAPYFLVMGSDSSGQSGCYNCDNIMHNLVMHEKFLSYSNYYKWVKFELSKWNS
jgi:MoaA/NifB/PqqE/SkfB family radical SAM enzyme